ncbi:MAG: sugar transferase [Bacteroidetes bacterium]|nr:sugar transferase [Bacteroidota bacterium]MCA6444504.1 sugar transferase [Bacteroidota bacterium]
MLKRLFDIFISLIGLICLLPFFLLIMILISIDSRGGVFYLQTRVGINNKDFRLFKFRTMHVNADKKGLLTVGGRDLRITRIGYYLRKYKLDELPQLLNVFFGTMSLVGPRPEVRKYVDLYTIEQAKILEVKPGITDYASLEYFDENELLAKSQEPEKTYIEEIMPAKLKLNAKYIEELGLLTDIRIILKTLKRIIGT